MLMLNNKLCLTSVVEFLRRGRVDRGTGGAKVVVVVDSSKQKVHVETISVTRLWMWSASAETAASVGS